MNLKEIFNYAVANEASDIHLLAGLPPTIRIDGKLINVNKKAITKNDLEQNVFSMLTNDQRKIFISTKELDFSYEVNNFRFRVNLHYEKNNVGLAARIIKKQVPTMEEIGMPKIIYDLINLQQGLILVTGPTGCGKSTSLAAMIDSINTNKNCNIITLEALFPSGN